VPLLFNIFLDFVVQQASAQFQCLDHMPKMSLFFNFKANFGGLFELEIISIFLYANDMAILVNDEHCIHVLEAITQRWGVDDQCKENKFWRGDWKVVDGGGGALPGNVTMPTPIIIQREEIGEVQDFKYLGSTLTISKGLDKELSCCWALATNKFVQLQPIWSNSEILLWTKMVFYKACISSILLYGCELWAFTQA
jgi:hypothetical protein